MKYKLKHVVLFVFTLLYWRYIIVHFKISVYNVVFFLKIRGRINFHFACVVILSSRSIIFQLCGNSCMFVLQTHAKWKLIRPRTFRKNTIYRISLLLSRINIQRKAYFKREDKSIMMIVWIIWNRRNIHRVI